MHAVGTLNELATGLQALVKEVYRDFPEQPTPDILWHRTICSSIAQPSASGKPFDFALVSDEFIAHYFLGVPTIWFYPSDPTVSPNGMATFVSLYDRVTDGGVAEVETIVDTRHRSIGSNTERQAYVFVYAVIAAVRLLFTSEPARM